MARKKATSKTPSGKRRSSRIKDNDAKNDISKLPSDLKKLVEDESLTLKQAFALAAETPKKSSRRSKSKSRSKKVATKASSSENKTVHWEFGGPIGAWITMWSLPAVNYWMLTSITKKSSVQDSLQPLMDNPVEWLGFGTFLTTDLAQYSFSIYITWFAFQVLLHFVLPGANEKGTVLPNGTRLNYYLNGFRAYMVTLIAFSACVMDKLHGTFNHQLFDPTSIFEDGVESYIKIFRAANMFAWVFALVLYTLCQFNAFDGGLNNQRCTGCVPYDYFMGSTTNPRVGWFDLKFFCESRPGLILWVMFNFSMALKQYEELDGRITYSMGLVCFFQFFYILDYFWQEQSILTTMDIKHDPFGWMLCWGDLVWVPFSYTLQGFYLYINPDVDVGLIPGVCIFALHFLGYRIFRESNNQKHNFRTGATKTTWGEKSKFIKTERGTKLLHSGWWGLSRHPNYLGDVTMALAYSLPCGFGSLFPYFYPIYFWILLVHRERRDNHHCSTKYGKDWVNYCEKVPYRIIPYVY